MKKPNIILQRTALAAAIAGAFAAQAASATDLPLFTVDSIPSNPNPYTIYSSQESRFLEVARSSSGDFAATFTKISNGTYTQYLRVYDSSGTPLGNAITLPANDSGYTSKVAMDKNGNIAVAWTDYLKNNTTGNIYIQRYSAAGVAQGSPIKVMSSLKAGFNNAVKTQAPAIAMDDDGDIAVAWTNATEHFYGGYYFTKSAEWSKTYAALYTSTGALKKSATIVDSVPKAQTGQTFDYGNVDWVTGLALNNNGDLLITLQTVRNFVATSSALLRNPNLVANGSPIALPDVKTFDGMGADSSGNFDIAWTDPADSSLHVSRYSSTASLLGSVGPVASVSSPDIANDAPTIAVAANGNFAVSWGTTVNGQSGTYQKGAQFFHADGSANGSAFVIATGTIGDPESTTSSAMDANGNLVVIWGDTPAGVSEAIQGSAISSP